MNEIVQYNTDTKIADKKDIDVYLAREFIKNNAVSINGIKVNDALKEFDKEDALFNKYLVIKRGKKNYYLVEINY